MSTLREHLEAIRDRNKRYDPTDPSHKDYFDAQTALDILDECQRLMDLPEYGARSYSGLRLVPDPGCDDGRPPYGEASRYPARPGRSVTGPEQA